MSAEDLSRAMTLKTGDVANGMALEAAWEHVRDEYAHRGFLDATVDPQPVFDDQAHNVSYNVQIEEGKPYRFGAMVITGLSVVAEKRLRDAWPIHAGEIFDKTAYEQLLTKLRTHPAEVFKDLPLHYDNVGHWVEANSAKGTADVLLDFK